ncbi:MAG: hypothetical protein ACRC1Z_17625 [Waterburya sp.]
MTELLQQALKKLSDLPADKQETIARLILQKIEQEEAKTNDDSLLPKSIGMGTSGRTDLSSQTNELLWQED